MGFLMQKIFGILDIITDLTLCHQQEIWLKKAIIHSDSFYLLIFNLEHILISELFIDQRFIDQI